MSGIDLQPLFDKLESDSERRDEIRDIAKGLDKPLRACTTQLARIHVLPAAQLPQIYAKVDEALPELVSALATLDSKMPQGRYYKYSDLFFRQIQTAAFVVVLRHFLEHERVPPKQSVASSLSLPNDHSEGNIWLNVEDYLHALISLLSELSRLAMNRVTMGDYDAPQRFSTFAKELSNAFSLLNLKNDNLRKRFDGIKYDVKRLEEIVYDLSLRGLTSTTTASTTGAAGSSEEEVPASKRARMDVEEQP